MFVSDASISNADALQNCSPILGNSQLHRHFLFFGIIQVNGDIGAFCHSAAPFFKIYCNFIIPGPDWTSQGREIFTGGNLRFMEYQLELSFRQPEQPAIRGQPDDEAIRMIREFEPLAIRNDPRGYCVCTSEGKDSRVLGHLMRRAGVRHFYLHSITGIDPPDSTAGTGGKKDRTRQRSGLV